MKRAHAVCRARPSIVDKTVVIEFRNLIRRNDVAYEDAKAYAHKENVSYLFALDTLEAQEGPTLQYRIDFGEWIDVPDVPQVVLRHGENGN